jgi:hypothetical protein
MSTSVKLAAILLVYPVASLIWTLVMGEQSLAMVLKVGY